MLQNHLFLLLLVIIHRSVVERWLLIECDIFFAVIRFCKDVWCKFEDCTRFGVVINQFLLSNNTAWFRSDSLTPATNIYQRHCNSKFERQIQPRTKKKYTKWVRPNHPPTRCRSRPRSRKRLRWKPMLNTGSTLSIAESIFHQIILVFLTRFRLKFDQRVRLNKNCRQVLGWKHRTTPSTSTEWSGEEAPWKSCAISCLLLSSEKWYQCRTSHGKVEHRREGSGTGTVICFSLEQLYLFIPFWIGSHIFILTKHTYFFYSEYLLQFWARSFDHSSSSICMLLSVRMLLRNESLSRCTNSRLNISESAASIF